ncbi:MAG: hypothetical protein WCJ95_18740 [Mariniphaga sp.]
MSYIKLHRKIQDWEWYTDANTFRLFVHLLINANYESKNWQGIDIERGQIVIGRKKLSEQLKLSEREIRTSITRLKTTNELSVKTTNKYSIVTICKYEDYQGSDKPERPTERPASRPTSDQQTTTTKEVKEKEEEKNKINVVFELFRQEYPGTKRGLNTELEHFLKKNDPETVHLLLPALEKEKQHRSTSKFVPNWKNLSTWIHQKCWEQEFTEEKPTSEHKQQTPKIPTSTDFDFESITAERLAAVYSKTKATA